jgi:hypothetical protein
MNSNAETECIEVVEPITYYESKKKEQRIQSLTNRNRILKTHLNYLRSKLEERDNQIELFTEVMVEMDDQSKIILN